LPGPKILSTTGTDRYRDQRRHGLRPPAPYQYQQLQAGNGIMDLTGPIGLGRVHTTIGPSMSDPLNRPTPVREPCRPARAVHAGQVFRTRSGVALGGETPRCWLCTGMCCSSATCVAAANMLTPANRHGKLSAPDPGAQTSPFPGQNAACQTATCRLRRQRGALQQTFGARCWGRDKLA
jgi:hypothetical protein